MGAFDNLLLGVDEGVSGIFSQWNVYTTALAGVLAAGVTYHVATSVDPDTHPLRLARQSLPNLVRQEGESAFYRSSDLGGGELRTGLEVRKKGALKWSKGSDGDLRDVWRQVVQGAEKREGVEAGARGKLLTVHGAQKVTEHKIGKVSSIFYYFLIFFYGEGEVESAVANVFTLRGDYQGDQPYRSTHFPAGRHPRGHLPPQQHRAPRHALRLLLLPEPHDHPHSLRRIPR